MSWTYLSPTSNSPDQSPELRPTSHYGVQLLATCQQAYDEGHQLYYTSNIFHLPPGPFAHTLKILQSIHPVHLRLIKEYVIDLSFVDLWPCDLTEECSDAVRLIKFMEETFKKPPDADPEVDCYTTAAFMYLLREWIYKVVYMERQWASHKADFWVEVNTPPLNEDEQRRFRDQSCRPLHRSQFGVGFDLPDPSDPWFKPVDPDRIAIWYNEIEERQGGPNRLRRSLESLCAKARTIADDHICSKMRQVGWKGFVSWLEKKSLEVYEEHVRGTYQHPEQWYRDGFEED